jgi:UDP-2,4-diacetamido-2,4,6-trideoxy-beta-L-altropyranose hydrolase
MKPSSGHRVKNVFPVLFRVDFSREIGAGHVVRCGALAEALRKHGVQTLLATTSHCKSRHDWRCLSFSKIVRIAARSNHSLSARDAELTLKLAHTAGSRCVIVDHYGATANYRARLKSSGLKVAVVDDVGKQNFWAADWLFNQNIEAEAIRYRVRPGCRKLLGPKFVLLRRQFAAKIQKPPAKGHKRLRVLVTMGGGDTAKLTGRILKVIAKVESPIQVCCVADGSSADLALLSRSTKNFRHPIELLPMVSDMVKLMAQADIAVCAGGSTGWEFCALGVPMLVFTLAANQKRNAIGLARAGCAKYLGSPVYGLKKLPRALERLVKNPDQRRTMGRHGRSLVDGHGAERAAQSLVEMLNDLP